MPSILVNDLVNNEDPDNPGIFDVLMASAATRIATEFKAGRINSTDFSTLYLNMQDSILSQSIQFLGAQVQAEVATQDILKGIQEIELLKKEGELKDKDIELKSQEILKSIQEIENLKEQVKLSQAQVAKSQVERDLLSQKVATERAQTENNADDNSVIGKQKNLYQAQTDGYRRDSEQKAAKIWAETWSIRKTTDPDLTRADSTNKLQDSSLGAIMQRLAAGVGVNI